ncbi:EAL domain-containing protein [Arcobacter sp. F2176]|uniref:EAL domain-containing response regulator n=1 Tax=Arcobacter sp. F2176 TaxID=2044511 RepID=UPI00100B8428|nr:EAL domain-containing protein [Arcobacter sp. F2176]RXJ81934.1 diguanylate cyclase [Arcobacter sp. F2176]
MFSKIIDNSYYQKNIKVLFIHTNKDFISKTSKLLEKYFISITISTNSDDVSEKLKEKYFDILFIDIDSSEQSCIEFVKQVKKTNPMLSIIAFSSGNNIPLLQECLKLSIDGYIFKPIIKEQFSATIEKVCDYKCSKYQVDNNVNYLNQYVKIIDSSNIISKTNIEGKITYVSENFCRITGYSKEELVGNTHSILKHKDNPPILYKEMWRTIKIEKKEWHGILKNVSKSGKVYYVKSTIMPLLDLDGNIIEFIAFRDSVNVVLDDKKHLLNKIELNNLSLLILVQIEEFDILDKFYNILKVDQIEKTFASNLLAYLPDNYVFEDVYALGDGRYALLTDYFAFEKLNMKIHDYLEIFVKNVTESVLEIDGIEYDLNIIISYSCGKYSLYEDARAGLEEAISKNKIINYSNDSSIKTNQEAKKNFEVIKMVKIALDNYKIVSYFQPIINNKTKEIEKYESLVRLINEKGEVISPVEFLNISKKGNYYNKITSRVLENSFKMLDFVNTKLSINLSALDIEKEQTRKEIFNLLDKYKKDNKRIVFELLEDENVKDFKSIKLFIRKVKRRGVMIAIDDFGAGYSNFERLLDFEPDILKIDGSLVKNIEKDSFSRNIIETIVSFAKKQKILTIAEYVENESIFNLLNEIGVDYSQGYYFGKPEDLIN